MSQPQHVSNAIATQAAEISQRITGKSVQSHILAWRKRRILAFRDKRLNGHDLFTQHERQKAICVYDLQESDFEAVIVKLTYGTAQLPFSWKGLPVIDAAHVNVSDVLERIAEPQTGREYQSVILWRLRQEALRAIAADYYGDEQKLEL